jgi:RNA polymerase sigma-B factor
LTLSRKMPSGNEVLLSGSNALASVAVPERSTQVAAATSPRISRSGMKPVVRIADGDGPNGLPAADQLVRTHMTLVKQIARKYSQYQPDSFEDLVQVGAIGLLKAIKYYDPHRTRSASFRTLATCYIRGEIRHYLRDHCSLVQVPRRLTEMNSQLSQLEEKLTKMLDRAPTVAELAQQSGFSVEDVLEAQQSWEARIHYESLDSGADEEERDDRRSLCDVVPDKRCQELFVYSEDREVVVQALKRLGDRTRQIVEFVFFYDLSQKETAYVLGLSEMGVSRAVHTALRRLKEIINSETR